MRRAALLLLLAAGAAAAQTPPAAPPSARALDLRPALADSAALAAQLGGRLSDAAAASLLTMAPGKEVYSLYGHSGVRITDPATGLDRTYNYGTFDFEQPGFVLRFMRGQLDYLLDTAPTGQELAKYAFLERPVVEQRLALRPETVRALYRLLEENARPENRAYRYDFVRDNCSTRIVDILDAALVESGQPRVALADTAPVTFRAMLAPYQEPMPVVDFGIDLALGAPLDRPATPREQTFLPEHLADAFDAATVGGRPLVAARDTILTVPGWAPQPDGPPVPLWTTLAVLALALGVTVLRRRGRRSIARAFDAVLLGVAGLAGTVVLLLWTATDHTVIGPNWQLAWLWPTHLAAAVRLGRPSRGLRVYAGVAAGATALVVLAWAALPQHLPLAGLPLALALATRLADRALAGRALAGRALAPAAM